MTTTTHHHSREAAMREITYTAYEAATALVPSGAYMFVQSGTADRPIASYKVVGVLSDTEFLAEGVRTGCRVHVKVTREYKRRASLTFTGTVDNGRDGEGVMLDVDPANQWTGTALVCTLGEVRRLAEYRRTWLAAQAVA